MSFSEEAKKQGEESPNLGPVYFEAREIAERCVSKFDVEKFKPLIEDLCSKINEKIWNDVVNYIMEDTESNIQNEIYRAVEACVSALLGGEQWALKKYVLGHVYDCGKIRKSICEHISEELQNKRIKDLERDKKLLEERINAYERFSG